MPNSSLILLPPTVLTEASQLGEPWDVGGAKSLHVEIRLLTSAGTGGTLTIQHAAVYENEAFVDAKDDQSSTASQTLTDSEGNYFITIPSFLRYVRWKTSGISGTSPKVSVYVVAKD